MTEIEEKERIKKFKLAFLIAIISFMVSLLFYKKNLIISDLFLRLFFLNGTDILRQKNNLELFLSIIHFIITIYLILINYFNMYKISYLEFLSFVVLIMTILRFFYKNK